MISGKIWGDTSSILENEFVQLHRINVSRGGVCSKHSHTHRYNGFLCITGRIIIRVWKNAPNYPGEPDVTVLTDGEFTAVPPGELHQFEALEETDMLEIYWPASLESADIAREAPGMIRD